MAELLAKTEYKIPTFSYGDLVEGTVIATSRREILVDLGAKSEGFIANRELEEGLPFVKNLKVGDHVLASVLQAENDQGYIVLSLKRAANERRWRELEDLFEKDKPLKVKVREYNRGGFLAEAAGVTGFIPMSHLKKGHFGGFSPNGENARVLEEEVGKMIGEELTVKIIEMDRNQNRLVLSEKEALTETERQELEKALASLKIGQVLEGRVTGIMPFGLFVELKGSGRQKALEKLEGLVHISEVAWEKVAHPRDLYRVNDKVKVKVLEVDPGLFKVALSIKQTVKNPWEGAEKRYKVGDVVAGEVLKIVPFGAFVRLEPGLDGLIHVTETTGPLKVGEKVKALVLEVNPTEQRLALSLKKLKTT